MPPDRPNLVFILADQLRADFLGCYGADYVKTPNIDALDAHGMRFDRAYSLHPVCVPARVSLLTGMDALKTGVLDNGQFLRGDYHELGIHTWPELLSANGYYTAAIGKMHFYPWDAHLGFQYRAIAEDKRWIHIRDDYYHYLCQHGLRKLHGNEHPGYFENKGAIVNLIPWEHSIDRFVGQEACRFIRRYGAEGPFAMMVGFPGPHCPYDPCEEFLQDVDPGAMPAAIPEVPEDSAGLTAATIVGNRLAWNGVDYTEFDEAEVRKVRAHYAALVNQIDHEVGEIVQALEETSLLGNTIVVFSSDHGDYLGDHHLIGKNTFYETAMRVPMIIGTPWHSREQTSEALVTLTDVTATLLDLARIEIPPYYDSIPLPGLGLQEGQERHQLIGATSMGWMIQEDRWRLCRYRTGESMLFDLQNDPTEVCNLYGTAEHLDARSRLETQLDLAVMEAIKQANNDRRVYTRSFSTEPWFGREGWERPYPHRIDEGESTKSAQPSQEEP